MLPGQAQQADQRADNSRGAALEAPAPRRTDAGQLPHEQPEVEAAHVDEQPLQNVGMQMCPSQVPRLKQMDI